MAAGREGAPQVPPALTWKGASCVYFVDLDVKVMETPFLFPHHRGGSLES